MVVLFLCMTAKAQDTRYAEHSVLREGSWAKVRIPKSGVYQLTNSLIRSCGFSDLKKVKIYGYGGALQPESLTGEYLTATDDLKEVPTCTVGNKRLFYGTGPVTWENATATSRIRNSYSDYGYYFLTENDAEPLTLSEADFKSTYYPAADDYHTLYEVDDYAWFHGGRQLFDQALYTIGTPKSYTLSGTGDSGTLTVALSYDGSFDATVAVNDSTVGTIQVKTNFNQYTKADVQLWTYELKGMVNSQNTIKITQTSGENLRLDYLALTCTQPKAWPDLATSSFDAPKYIYRITNQDHQVHTICCSSATVHGTTVCASKTGRTTVLTTSCSATRARTRSVKSTATSATTTFVCSTMKNRSKKGKAAAYRIKANLMWLWAVSLPVPSKRRRS